MCGVITGVGSCLDFLTILLTGTNSYYYMNMNLEGLYFNWGLISGAWYAFNSILAVYVGIEILQLKKKWYIMSVYIFLGVIYEIVIFFDPQGSMTFIFPLNPGEDLIGGYFRFGSIAYFLLIIFNGSIFFFLGFSFLYKGLQSIGVIRKKYLFLAIGDFMTSGFGSFFVFSNPQVLLSVFFTILLMLGFVLKYLGIKEESAEPKKKRTKKEVKVEDSLFMISKRPTQLTEEEVTITKEKRICLVCKGKLARKMYVCPKCNTLYCDNCSDALVDLENACWVCNTPIDESKPTEPFDIEQEDINIEEFEKSKKKEGTGLKKYFHSK